MGKCLTGAWQINVPCQSPLTADGAWQSPGGLSEALYFPIGKWLE